MHTSDRRTTDDGVEPGPTSVRGSDIDGRVLLLALLLIWPLAAALPVLLGAPPIIAIPWIVAVTAAGVRWTIYPSPASRRATRRARLRAAGLGATWRWVLAAACATVVIAESSHLAYSRWVAEPAQPRELWDAYARRGPAHVVALLFLLAGIGPMTEEFALRGLVTRRLEARVGVAGAILGSSVIFAALHMSGRAFPEFLIAGVVLGGIAWGARSAWASVIAHGAWNAFAFSEQFWERREAALFAPVRTWVLAAVCVVCAAILAALVSQMRWRSGALTPADKVDGDG